MPTVTQRRRLTAEDLACPGVPEKFVELVEGEAVEMTPGGKRHNRIASEFEFLFRAFCKSRPDLDYGGDNDGFAIERDPDTVLSPDASLFRRREGAGTWMDFAPEIVVEVLSPSNSPMEIAFKRNRFFEAGTEQFWTVDLERKRLEIHHRDGRLVLAEGGDVVEGEGIAEGLRVDLKEIFRALEESR